MIKRKAGAIRRSLARRGLAITTNDRRLKALEGRHARRRAFLLGMGPSLKLDDILMLKQEITFSCNKIYLAFEQTDWRPSYYSICDVLVANNNREQILEADFGGAVPIHDKLVRPILGAQRGACFYDRSGIRLDAPEHDAPPKLPGGMVGGLHSHGYSVVMDMIQLAWGMGVREIILLGIDFSFDLGKQTGRQSVSGEVLKSEGEVNHFHPDYRKPGETWTMPRMEEQRRAFDYCRTAIEAGGGRLLNASRQTKLDVVPRVALEEVLRGD